MLYELLMEMNTVSKLPTSPSMHAFRTPYIVVNGVLRVDFKCFLIGSVWTARTK